MKNAPPITANPMPTSIAELPAQKASAPTTPAQSRGLYYNTGNAFNVSFSDVPDNSFVDQPRLALDHNSPTALFTCDSAKGLNTDFPATTPLVLAHYARVRAGETLVTNFEASGVIVYVMVGSGSTECGTERVDWKPGDVFILPGGCTHTHKAGVEHAVLWIVTNEPQLSFERLRSPAKGNAPTEVVHFTADEITRQIDLLYAVGRGNDIAGSALIFASTGQQAIRNVLPTLTLAMNSLPAGLTQRSHKHNSVAVSLVIQGEGCHSLVGGRRKDWSQWATTITPATAFHSHHNEGSSRAMFLIVQDGGIYNHTRALGFSFEAP